MFDGAGRNAVMNFLRGMHKGPRWGERVGGRDDTRDGQRRAILLVDVRDLQPEAQRSSPAAISIRATETYFTLSNLIWQRPSHICCNAITLLNCTLESHTLRSTREHGSLRRNSEFV